MLRGRLAGLLHSGDRWQPERVDPDGAQTRCFVVVNASAGGPAAADWVREWAQELNPFRSRTPPTPLSEILSTDEEIEVGLLQAGQAANSKKMGAQAVTGGHASASGPGSKRL